MILVVLACVIAWARIGRRMTERVVGALLACLLVSGMTAIIAGSVPVVEIPTGPNQELRVMPPTAFPLAIQQHRDYDTDQFYYRIVLGWPDGIPVYQTVPTDDQSHLIRWTGFGMMVVLGLWMLLGGMLTVAFMSALQWRRNICKHNERAKGNRRKLLLMVSLSTFSASFLLYRFAGMPPFLPGALVFDVGFWGLHIGLGLFIIALLVPRSSQ